MSLRRITHGDTDTRRPVKKSVASRRGLATIQHVARFKSATRIDGGVSFIDMLNNAFFIDHEGGSISKPLLFVEDAIVFDYSAFEIAEQGKSDSDLLGKLAVSRNTVNTKTKNLSFV